MKEFIKSNMSFVLPDIYWRVRKKLKSQIKEKELSIIDIGGRRSPYTSGINSSFTILDKAPEDANQVKLKLGISERDISVLKKNKKNIKEVIFSDIFKIESTKVYDGALCVEVIEHIENDQEFVRIISEMIKPGGFLILTTPNGDYIKNEPPNYNPDHVRHYRKKELDYLLKQFFKTVEVDYAVKTGKYRIWGLKPIKISKPISLVKTVIGNVVNHWQSANVSDLKNGTAHLIAYCRK